MWGKGGVPLNRKKKQFFGMNIGSASMMLIFVILCLVSFAALSIVSANADRRLSRKIAERTSAYYEACNSAYESLAGIDKVLQEQFAASADADAYFNTVGHCKSYAIPVNEVQTLYVEIEILYPESVDDNFYRVTTWKIITE